MRFAPTLLDEIRARLPVSQVVARKVALKKAGREFKGLSPFKTERTPSFFVNDHKGFYHCFASGEHGDIFTFVMKVEGLSFPEAVERLAAEAGVVLPKPGAREERAEDERARLHAVLEASAGFFADALKGPDGGAARDYLERRGLRRETIGQFRIGYAPNRRSALRAHLAAAGYSEAEMVKSGMLIAADDPTAAYDRFRHRVMFPITDLKDRVIAFGGRALDPQAPAKYLNSPETALFHKGSVLFNGAKARPLAHARGQVVAVEGYMDVLALTEAGLGHAVAPLGTALTEDQIRLLWRMAPEPVLCFDGDSAGRRAAFRAVEVVLPHLRPGASVRFAALPDGLDPDDLVRQQGADAIRTILDRARPLADMLWEREWTTGHWSTPERRAGLEKQLFAQVRRIADPAVRSHYERAMRERLAAAWSATGPAWPRFGPAGFVAPRQPMARGRSHDRFAANRWAPPAVSSSLRQSPLVEGHEVGLPYREALLMHALINHPRLIEEHAEAIAALPLTAPALARLRDGLLSVLAGKNPLDRAYLRSHLDGLGLAKVVDLVERTITHRSDRFAEPDTDQGEVDAGWRHILAQHERLVGLRKAMEAAERSWHEDGSEEALARIYEVQGLLASVENTEVLGDA